MFGDGDPFSDFFHTFFGGAAERTAGAAAAAAARRRAAAQGRDVEQRDRARRSRTRSTARRAGSSIKHDGHARTVDVRIPAGVGDGSRVRVAGEGEHGAGGGAAGDLYLRVRLAPHPRFERKGQDLYTRVAVPLTTAVLGGEAEVPTLGGQAAAAEDSADDAERARCFRLKGHGMPAVGKPDERGDLYATVDVQLPHDADARAARSTSRRCRNWKQTHASWRERETIMNINKYTEKAQEAVARRAAARRAARATRRSSPSTCSSRSSSSTTASSRSCSAR